MTVKEAARRIEQTKEDAGILIDAVGALRRQGLVKMAADMEFAASELLGELS